MIKKYECRISPFGYKDDKYVLYDQNEQVTSTLTCDPCTKYPAWLCEERMFQLLDAMKRPDLKNAKGFILLISDEPIPDSFEISSLGAQQVAIPVLVGSPCPGSGGRETDKVSVWLGISLLLKSMGGTVWVSFGETL